ncbi:MAG: PBP1A family penicillin-binding protein [Deltaproteobacteria bacterium]|nr:PBP1A family penicillin-binding protein [Deltaproteobacteria bacterium]
MKVVFDDARPNESRLRRGLRWVAFVTLTGLGAVGIIGIVSYGVFASDVPDFKSIDDYRPKVVTQVFSQQGELIGEFFRERRIVLPYKDIPPRLIQGVLASEDDRFFEHSGIDYVGILRAAVKNLKAGRVVQGGSTITQQVAKSLLISEEGYKRGSAKKLSRKIREAILARRLERNLSKEDILALYLNQIFLGNQAYGVQAAAQNYFRKNVDELSLAETALLAGLPQAPSRFSPIKHPKAAKGRREYVLRRMLEEGFISQTELNEARDAEVKIFLAPDYARNTTPYFTEQVRRELLKRYDENALLEQGLRVFTTVDTERYRAAEDAVYNKLRLVDRRQGYRGPLAHMGTAKEQASFLEAYSRELKRLGRDTELKDGELYVGLIRAIDEARTNISLSIGTREAVLPLSAMRWARSVNPQKWFEGALLSKIPKSFQVGDVLLVRATTRDRIKSDQYAGPFMRAMPTDPTIQFVALEQEPNLEAALLSVESESGYVLAMIGGYSFDRSEFNRALQACRQPGSSFKPIVYAAALDLKHWTPSSTVLDAPVTFDDPRAGKRWKPANFNVSFEGEVCLRYALQKSMNVPAVRVLEAVGLGPATRYAERLGITTELKRELGLVLGSSCVKMEDMVNAYSIFANYGEHVRRRLITRVIDRDQRVLFDDGYYKDPWAGIGLKVDRAKHWLEDPPERIIDQQTGFLITKMMRNVVEGGTGTGARAVRVPVAGKTGTTNDSFDAWFIGFTTEITTAVWVGYDDYVTPMGRYEQGGRAALPLWVSYMKKAIKKKTGEFKAPPGINFVRIDPKTGYRARGDTPGAVLEAYRAGTEPKEYVAARGAASPDEFGLTDGKL